MTAYFQMGHNSENLVGEEGLQGFKGIVLSPVNRSTKDLEKDLPKFREKGSFNIVFDPQLYLPRSNRGKLRDHPYFPSDFETGDISSKQWWNTTVEKLGDYALSLKIDAIASPVTLPKTWSPGYYSLVSDVCDLLKTRLETNKHAPRVYVTVAVSSADLATPNKALEIASIVSRADSDGYYLVLVSDVEPRRELYDAEELFGFMTLIRELKQTNRKVIVSHSSSDMILAKIAGADDCATGKFFNLRRFTKSRYEEPSGGGGQIAYWLEHALMSFIREADLLRLKSNNFSHFIQHSHSNNGSAAKIIDLLSTGEGKAWLALCWRQYLSWFASAEAELSQKDAHSVAGSWFKDAEKRWEELENNDILFDESRNDGRWLRPWRQALNKFKKEYKL